MASRVIFDGKEISTLVLLAATLDPAKYKHPATIALIWKCKAERDNPSRILTVQGDPNCRVW